MDFVLEQKMRNDEELMRVWQRRCGIALLLVVTTIGLHEASAEGKESSRRSPVVIAVEKVGPAVVNISTIVHERVSPFFPFAGDDFFRDFFPDLFSREYSYTSLGSGVIIDGEKGYVVTNHHVVSRATEIKVITSDEKEYVARLLGSDPRSDLAVLKVDAKEKLPEVKMGNSDDLMIGETVVAIGNPFGLSHTVTTGVISATDRSVRTEERVYRGFIQTDASINPGNSGGPLLNIEGEFIGINTAIYQKAQGIGFAIPINKAKRIVNELLRSGEVRPPWLGIEVQELTPELKVHFGLPSKSTGVLVNDLFPGSAGASGGIQRGDIILSVENIPVPSVADYRDAVAEFTSSDVLNLKVFRKGKESTIALKASPFPAELAVDLFYRRLGIRVGDSVSKKGGVSIKEVRRDSEAGRVGMKPGDLILQVNNSRVGNLDDFRNVISRSYHLPSLNLLVQRGAYGYSLTLPF
jgi:Do/DeqQ family serine protease